MIGIFTYTFTINLSHMYGKHASHMEHMGVEIFFSHRNDTHTHRQTTGILLVLIFEQSIHLEAEFGICFPSDLESEGY